MSCVTWSFEDTLRATDEYIDTLRQRGEYTLDAAKLLSGLRDWWTNLQELEHLANQRRHEPYSDDLRPSDAPEADTLLKADKAHG